MSRTLPSECEHGVIVDWGDFGPRPGVAHPVCPECEAKPKRVLVPSDSIPSEEDVREVERAAAILEGLDMEGADIAITLDFVASKLKSLREAAG